ncbi:MAG TPA: hypothetical protein VMT34_17475 [Aggregatilineales bacterium]|nr:hypothetical protein [Aggregatilineales bacterium]
MNYPPLVQSVVTKLSRAELAGVSAHTLPIALERAARDSIVFDDLTERQIALLLLDRAGYPETMAELDLFLKPAAALSSVTLTTGEITEQHAITYIRWLVAFLIDPDLNVQKNARLLLRWLVTQYHAAIAAQPAMLDGYRRLVDDPNAVTKNAAFIVYTLGLCGVPEDYDYIIRLAEIVIEHDREHIGMVVDALYRLYPPALISALSYFLESSTAGSKQFAAGLHLLAQVAEIDDQAFWTTFYDDMDRIVAKVNDSAGTNSNVTRILDRVEKHLAFVGSDSP